MKGNVVRLFEHIKLLQRGVEISQEGKITGDSQVKLRQGLNGKPVRIGLLGATSAGKTTLIHRLLSDSAGKISSKPETACLVIHSFSKVENIVLRLNKNVVLKDGKKSSEFREFIKKFKLIDCYERNSELWWRAVDDEVTKEFGKEKILEFFDEVNNYDNVFESIKWNHKQRQREYSLTDLIDIYDLPGFGGKEAHDETASAVLGHKEFDVLIYLIDSSKGIPGEDEKEHLATIKSFLDLRPSYKMYWAYEKPLPVDVDVAEAEENIRSALSSMGIDIDVPLLDLTGYDVGSDGDDVCERVLCRVLKPYFIDAGKEYYNQLFSGGAKRDSSVLKNAFDIGVSSRVIENILDKIDMRSKEIGKPMSINEAEKYILDELGVEKNVLDCTSIDASSSLAKNNLLTGVTKGAERLWKRFDGLLDKIYNDKPLQQEKVLSRNFEESEISNISDIEIAISKVVQRIRKSVAKIVYGITNKVHSDRVSIDLIRDFKRDVYNQDPDLRTLVYDIQFYLILKNHDSVRSYIMKPIVDSLRENIKREIDDIEKFSEEEEGDS